MLALRSSFIGWCDWHWLPESGGWVLGPVLFSWDWDCWMCYTCVASELKGAVYTEGLDEWLRRI